MEARLRDALEILGAGRVRACLLAALLPGAPRTTKQLMEETGLRQPEVSTGMKVLVEEGMVRKERVEAQGRGRPMHAYCLAVPARVVLRPYCDGGKASIARTRHAIDVLTKA